MKQVSYYCQKLKCKHHYAPNDWCSFLIKNTNYNITKINQRYRMDRTDFNGEKRWCPNLDKIKVYAELEAL